jgi:hypothetical protein
MSTQTRNGDATDDAVSNADRGPVFVAGYPRSGTTLVYRILAQDHQFGAVCDSDSAHETAISVYMNPLTDLRAVYRQPWPGWRSVITDTEQFDRFATSVSSLGRLRRTLEGWLTRQVFRDSGYLVSPMDVDSLATRGNVDPAAAAAVRRLAMRISARRRVVREFVDLYTQASGAHRFLEKYPFNYYRYVELHEALPEARFVHVFRDPRDVYASMVHRARLELRETIPIGRVSWMILAAQTFARDWLASIRAAIAFRRLAPDRILLLRYEDITANAAATLHVLGRFTGVDPSLFPLTDDRAFHDPDKKFPLSSSVPIANSGRFLGEVHMGDLASISRTCAPVLATLGYSA